MGAQEELAKLAAVVDVTLEPGQFSLHHVNTIHGSNPNKSARRRAGIAFRYVRALTVFVVASVWFTCYRKKCRPERVSSCQKP